MGIYKTTDRNGRKRVTWSVRWPDGFRTRKYAPNHTVAKQALTRAQASKQIGTWQEVKDDLSGKIRGFTVRAFYGRWMEEYCEPRLKPRSRERYVLSFKYISKKLGNKQLKSLSMEDAHAYIRTRSREVSPATINRDIAALKKMLSHARECGVIESHPLAGFRMLKEPQKPVQVISMAEYRHLIECARDDFKPMLVVIGETAIRRAEAMALTWQNVNLGERMLSLEHKKKVR